MAYKAERGDYSALAVKIEACANRAFREATSEAVSALLGEMGWDNAVAVVDAVCSRDTIPQNIIKALQDVWLERRRSMATTRGYYGHKQADEEPSVLPPNRMTVCEKCGGQAQTMFSYSKHDMGGIVWQHWDCAHGNVKDDGKPCGYTASAIRKRVEAPPCGKH